MLTDSSSYASNTRNGLRLWAWLFGVFVALASSNVTAQTSDFGDHYFTATSSASQVANSAIRIGTNPTDAEASDPSNSNANADSLAGINDEDLVMPVFTVGTKTNLVIPVTLATASLTGSTSRINVWVDWNGDGLVTGTSETQTVKSVTTNGSSNTTFALKPPAGTTGGTKFLRIRINESSTAPAFSGASAKKGEVEDYAITVIDPTSLDYGDWNGVGAATGTASSGLNNSLRLGSLVDAETTVTSNSTATGDDTTGSDDEDAVSLPSAPWSIGESKNVVITVTNNTGSNGYLGMWIDYNGDGYFEDSGENVLRATIATGATNLPLTYAITPLKSGTNLGVRVRLSSDSAVSATSAVGSGEIEDYVTTINAIGTDQCYKWTMDNTNEDWTVDPVSELDPDATLWTPQINGESFGTIRYATMSYNPTTQELRGTVRIKVYTGTNPFQGFWLSLSEGPLPRGLERAIIYYDGYNPTSPKMTMYMYDTTSSQLSWSTPGKLLSSSITGSDLQPGPMVNEGSNYYRVDFTANLANVNNRDNFPSYSMPTDWQGARFGSEVGVWFHYFKFSGAPTYNGTGALTSFPVDETTVDSSTGYKKYIGWFDTGTWPALLKASLITKTLDYGDHAGFPVASQTASTVIRIGTNPTDAEDGPAYGGTADKDDKTATNDEDLTLPTFTVGTATSLVIPVTLATASLTGSTSRLNVFVDWNGDGDVADTGETQSVKAVSTNGASNATFSITPPAGTTPGTKFLRIRITEGTTSPTFSGASASKGEVEDFAITVLSAVSSLTVGNLVWRDDNNNGVKDAAEPGIDGVTVQLYSTTNDTIGDSDDVQVGSNVITAGGGLYSFTGLLAGKYFVKIPTVPAGYTMSSGVPDAGLSPTAFAENDQDNDNNGIHVTGIGTAVTSGLVNLTVGGESITDGDTNANTNLTVDFGFTAAQTCPTYLAWPDWRTLTRSSPTAGTGWISQPLAVNAAYTSQSFSNVLGSGTAVTVSYTNNMYDNKTPNIYVPRWDPSYDNINTNSNPDDQQCNPMFYGAIRFTNNSADTSTSVTTGVGTATGHPKVEITFDKDVLMDDFNLGSIGKIGNNVREWAFVRAYTSTGTGVAPVSITGQTVSCDAVTAGAGPEIINNGAAGAYIGGLDDQQAATPVYGNASFAWNTTPIRKIEIQFWRSNGTSTWNTAPAGGQASAAIHKLCFRNAPLNDYGDHIFGTLATSTASQTASPDIRIGTAATDAEATDPSDANADKDNTTGTNDEDLTMPTFTVGSATALSIPVTLNTATIPSGRINVWVDWNDDGDVLDTSEALTVQSVTSSGTKNFSLTPPVGTPGGVKYLRIRITEGSTAPTFAGSSALRGEVEDYAISVNCTSISITPPLLPNGQVGAAYSQALGSAPLATYWEVTQGSLPSVLSLNSSTGVIAGTPTTAGTYNFTVTATITPGAANGQLKFTTYNLDLNPGQTFNIRDYVVGASNANATIDWSKVTFTYTLGGANSPTVPADWNLPAFNNGAPVTTTAADATAAGNSGQGEFLVFILRDGQASFDDKMNIRVNSSATSNLTTAKASPIPPTACFGTKAYSIVINPSPLDFGDWNGAGALTTTTSSIVDPNLHLGSTIDAETSVSPNSTATADDTTNTGSTDDEDGLVGTPILTAGATNFMTFMVTNNTAASAYLNVWIDFNNDSDFGDTGEHVVTDNIVFSGTIDSAAFVQTAVPAGAVTGSNLGMRVRLTSTNATPPTGTAGTGEVEDYLVTVQPMTPWPCIQSAIYWCGTDKGGDAFAFDHGLIDYLRSRGFLITPGVVQGGSMKNPNTGASLSVNAADFNIVSNSIQSQMSYDDGGLVSALKASTKPVLAFTIGGVTGSGTGTLALFADIGAAGSEGNIWIENASASILPSGLTSNTSLALYNNPTLVSPAGNAKFICYGLGYNASATIGAYYTDPPTNSNATTYLRYEPGATLADGTTAVGRRVWLGIAQDGAASYPPQINVASSTNHFTAAGKALLDKALDVTAPCPATFDFGDWNGSGAATTTTYSTVISNVRLGATVDVEASVTPNAAATADDTTGSDDEDGVTVPSTASRGASVPFTYVVTNTNASGVVRVCAWVDWNNNGTFDATEQILTDDYVNTGTVSESRTIYVDVPTAAVTGVALGVRFRITDVANATTITPTGAMANGEVEDYTITLSANTKDYSDAPATYGSADHTLVAGLGLGWLTDAEAAVQTSATANGDDIAGLADEDGVYFDSPIVAGGTARIVISGRGTGFLNAWVDWNRNGTFDAGEQIVTNTSVALSTGNYFAPVALRISVPSTAVAGTSFVRVRLTSTSGTTATGSATSGEVEDYQVTIVPGATISGKAWKDNDNGIQDVGELGLPGFVISLYKSTGKAEAFTVTDGTGAYSFTGLAAGTYYAVVDLPTSHTLSGMDLGGNDAVDSDFNNSTFQTANIVLAAGGAAANVAAGINVPANTISYAVLTNLATTEWTNSFVLPKLDPSIGTVTAVQVRSFAHEDQDFFYENVSPSAGGYTFSSINKFTLTLPNATTLANTQTYNDSADLPGMDSCIDYHGTSGVANYDVVRIIRRSTINYITPATFGGVGTISLSGATNINSNNTAINGNASMAMQTYVAGLVAVTYTYTPVATDFGDWNGSGAATTTTYSTVSTNLRLGATVDAEASVTPDSAATADGADEDGVPMPANITEGQLVTLPVSVFNNSGASAYLNAWIDYNGDGTFDNSVYGPTALNGELVQAETTVPSSASAQTITLSFAVPTTTLPGAGRGVRLRLTSTSGTVATGAAGTGEVEDYVVRICRSDMIVPEVVAQGAVGSAYSQVFTAQGATAPLTWSFTGSAIPGLTFNTGTATLSGTPTTAGTYTFRMTLSDAAGCSDTNNYTLIISNGSGTVCADANAVALGTSGRRWGYVTSGPPYEPGLSVKAPFSNYGVLAGTSLRLQSTTTGGFSNITSQSSAIGSASRTTPTWGGSGRVFRDSGAGVPNGNIAFTEPECSAYACWTPSLGAYQWTLTVTPNAVVTPDGIYWECIYNNVKFSSVKVNGTTIATNIGPVATAVVQGGNSGETFDHYYYFVPYTTAMSSGTAYTITVEAPVGVDPLFGDFALLGCPAVAPVAIDFGDWNGSGAQTSTTSSNVDTNILLGATVDAETSVTPNAAATADDLAGSDDEDSVTTLPTLTQGQVATITVNVTNTSSELAYLSAWIDYNNDGTFGNDATETLYAQSVAIGASNVNVPMNFTVPAGAVVGNRGLRVRISSDPAMTAVGAFGSGEIEDYIVTVAAPALVDYGDWNGSGAQTTSTTATVLAGLRIGATIDSETSVIPNATATADGADEDGVFFPSNVPGSPTITTPVTAGTLSQLSINATNTTGANAYLNAWIDFNNNGIFDPAEQVATDVLVPTGTVDYIPNPPLTDNSAYRYFRQQYLVPANAVPGNRGLRVRLSNQLNAAATGTVGAGEIEDYLIAIAAPAACYHFKYADANSDRWFDPITESQPTQPSYAASYWDYQTLISNPANMGYIRQLEMSYAPASKLFSFEGTFTQPTPGGPTKADGIWFVVNSGPFGLPNTQQFAIVYIDGFDRNAPKVTIYVENTNSHGSGWQSPGNLLLSTAPNGPNASDVKQLQVVQDPGTGNVTFRLTLDATHINDRAYWPAGYSLPADWQGLQFASTAGLWFYVMDLNPAPTYVPATGALQALYYSGLNHLGMDMDPMGIRSTVTEACSLDYGDLPDTGGGTGPGNYQTLSSDNGPSHLLTASTLRLGVTVDAEANGQPNATATGDGADDNGIAAFPAFIQGSSANISVSVFNNTGSSAKLYGFVDWNGDGSFSPVIETLSVVSVPSSASQQTLTLTAVVPTGISNGNVGARFRLSSDAALTAVGSASNGEVEDYIVAITSLDDHGDFAPFADASASPTTAVRLGSSVTDAEVPGLGNATATGDDGNGTDDEDGAAVPTSFTIGIANSITVNVTNTSGAPAFLSVWIDFNHNNVLEVGEQVVSNVGIANGTNAIDETYVFNVPGTAVSLADVGVRVRISSVSGTGPTGAGGAGEVEDYRVRLCPPKPCGVTTLIANP